jgi:hypothetical protein
MNRRQRKWHPVPPPPTAAAAQTDAVIPSAPADLRALNPLEDAAADYLQTVPDAVLLSAARGDVDLNALALRTLWTRGHGRTR